MTGFEPARENPNNLASRLLNHSDTLTFTLFDIVIGSGYQR
jgi:hypothetical protein